MKSLLAIFFIVLAFGVEVCTPSYGWAQGQRDSKGRDFWMSFLPNVHGETDSLFFSITADSATNGSVELTMLGGQKIRRTFSISDPRRVAIVNLPVANVELQASLRDTLFSSDSQSGRILSTQTIHIQAEKEVSITALNKGSMSSDALLLLPTDMVGRSYIVLGYGNAPRYTVGGSVDKNRSSSSQFCIVAPYDSTLVELQLSADVVGSARQRTLLLMKGQCFFAEAEIKAGDAIPADLSGSRISSTKPIAVFAGQQQARVPWGDSSQSRDSRNVLCEQLIPLELWDTSFVVIPFPVVTTSAVGSDLVRIIASADNTLVRINGQLVHTLAFAEIYEAPIQQAMSIESSNPVMVMQYKKSSAAQSDASAPLSDASMMTVLPSGQFLTSYRFNSLQVRQGTVKSFTEQYAMLVVPSDAVPSIQFDGAPISTVFTPVAGSDYSVAVRKVADGFHTISCSKPFGVYVCGYGIGDMYSYATGMAARHFPYLKAHLSINDNQAAIGDSTSFALRLEALSYPPPVLRFRPSSYSFVVRFNATLLTPSNPAYRGEIVGGYQYARFSGRSSSLNIGDTLIQLPMICGLGDADLTTVEVESMLWIDESGDTIPSALTQRPGVFRLTDVWSDSLGKRLVNPQGSGLYLSLQPNPTPDRSYCAYAVPKDAQDIELKIYNAMGEEVSDFSAEAWDKKDKGLSLLLEKGTLPNGIYYVRLTSGTQSLVRPLVFF